MAFISGCLWSMGNFFIIKGVDQIGISKTTIFMNSSSIFTVILAFMLFQEIMDILMWIGLPLLIAGALVVAFVQEDENGESKKAPWKGYLLVVLAAAFFALARARSSSTKVPVPVVQSVVSRM